MKFLLKLGDVVRALLRIIDINLCFIWLAPLYLVGLADKPTGRQLISGYVGKAAYYDMPWGIRAAIVIDTMAEWLGDGPDHCYRAYIFYLPIDVD